MRRRRWGIGTAPDVAANARDLFPLFRRLPHERDDRVQPSRTDPISMVSPLQPTNSSTNSLHSRLDPNQSTSFSGDYHSPPAGILVLNLLVIDNTLQCPWEYHSIDFEQGHPAKSFCLPHRGFAQSGSNPGHPAEVGFDSNHLAGARRIPRHLTGAIGGRSVPQFAFCLRNSEICVILD